MDNTVDGTRFESFGRQTDAFREAKQRLPELTDDDPVGRLEGEGGITLEQDEVVEINPKRSTKSDDMHNEIARFVGEGGLPSSDELDHPEGV